MANRLEFGVCGRGETGTRSGSFLRAVSGIGAFSPPALEELEMLAIALEVMAAVGGALDAGAFVGAGGPPSACSINCASMSPAGKNTMPMPVFVNSRYLGENARRISDAKRDRLPIFDVRSSTAICCITLYSCDARTQVFK